MGWECRFGRWVRAPNPSRPSPQGESPPEPIRALRPGTGSASKAASAGFHAVNQLVFRSIRLILPLRGDHSIFVGNFRQSL
ncbi:hypothetical protein SBV1_130115 [Verrucomicrobia bacterium]|nr:hypothetical protein SBV1_130115 [Verrucomicrobiota bacterium]